MMNVRSITSEIKDNLKQKTGSRKDEVTVMQAMLNDPSYTVGIYTKEGKTGDYCPSADARNMVANIVATTTKISSHEAKELASGYEFTKSDAQAMVNVSKEFVNTYLETGRKLPLGGRKSMSANLILKHVPEREKNCSFSDTDGVKKTTHIPAHDAIKVICPCPSWLK